MLSAGDDARRVWRLPLRIARKDLGPEAAAPALHAGLPFGFLVRSRTLAGLDICHELGTRSAVGHSDSPFAASGGPSSFERALPESGRSCPDRLVTDVPFCAAA